MDMQLVTSMKYFISLFYTRGGNSSLPQGTPRKYTESERQRLLMNEEALTELHRP